MIFYIHQEWSLPIRLSFLKNRCHQEVRYLEYEELLPSLRVMQWMSFMISLNLAVNQDFSRPKVEYRLEDEELTIILPNRSFFN